MADIENVPARECRELTIFGTADGVRICESRGDLRLAVSVTWDELVTAYAMKDGKRKSFSSVKLLGEPLVDGPLL